jgi:hypothetical protein
MMGRIPLYAEICFSFSFLVVGQRFKKKSKTYEREIEGEAGAVA